MDLYLQSPHTTYWRSAKGLEYFNIYLMVKWSNSVEIWETLHVLYIIYYVIHNTYIIYIWAIIFRCTYIFGIQTVETNNVRSLYHIVSSCYALRDRSKTNRPSSLMATELTQAEPSGSEMAKAVVSTTCCCLTGASSALLSRRLPTSPAAPCRPTAPLLKAM